MPLSHWLYKGMIDAGFEAVLMETRQVKGALKALPIKTDRRDAEGIARLLQMGWFRPVHCKTVSSQEMRALLTSRKSVLDAIIRMEISLRGVLRNFGLKLGRVSKGRYEARVRELVAGNAMLEAAAEPILRARADLRRELAGLEKLVRTLARHTRSPQQERNGKTDCAFPPSRHRRPAGRVLRFEQERVRGHRQGDVGGLAGEGATAPPPARAPAAALDLSRQKFAAEAAREYKFPGGDTFAHWGELGVRHDGGEGKTGTLSSPRRAGPEPVEGGVSRGCLTVAGRGAARGGGR